MRQAIVTKYLPYTSAKPSRIKAICSARSLTVSYDHALSADENHMAAAKALAEAMSATCVEMYGDAKAWRGIWVGGAMPQRSGAGIVPGYCFTLAQKPNGEMEGAFEL